MARGKMKTLHGLYKRMGREAFLETARYYSNHVHGSIETTVGEMESRWYDSAHTMTEAEKMVEDYVDLTDSEMRHIRNRAIETVRKSHGFLLFERALAEERSLSGD